MSLGRDQGGESDNQENLSGGISPDISLLASKTLNYHMITRLNFFERLQVGVAMGIVFLLVFATNRLDKRHFEEVQGTLNTVFEDRVVAQDYIYQLTGLYHRKALQVAAGTGIAAGDESARVEELLRLFEQTKLTPDEERHLAFLFKHHEILLKVEAQAPPERKKSDLQDALASVDEDLANLAAIQVKESHRLTRIAQKSLDSTSLNSKIHISVLVVVGILMQILIFVKPWKA